MKSGAATRQWAWWLCRELEKIVKLVLSGARFLHLSLEAAAQIVQYSLRNGCLLMPPAPDSHAADTEDPRGGAITSKGHFEDQIVLATGESAFKAR